MQYTDITSRALTYLLRSPHLHIDMTEAIYRGLAEICCAQPDGVLLRLRAQHEVKPRHIGLHLGRDLYLPEVGQRQACLALPHHVVHQLHRRVFYEERHEL